MAEEVTLAQILRTAAEYIGAASSAKLVNKRDGEEFEFSAKETSAVAITLICIACLIEDGSLPKPEALTYALLSTVAHEGRL